MAKNLPIRLFKKRDNDKLLNNLPGGSATGNRFRLQGAALTGRAATFRSYFGGVNERLLTKKQQNVFLPIVVKLILNEDALAKSYRTDIGKLFNNNKKINIIGLIGEDQLLVKIDNESDLEYVLGKIRDEESNAIGISAIEKAEDFRPIIDNGDITGDVKVKLINYGDPKLNSLAEADFVNLCSQMDVSCRRLNYADDLIIYKVSGLQTMGLTNFSDSDSIFSVTKVPSFTLTKSGITSTGTVDIKVPDSETDYHEIGVFDEGISEIKHLKDWKSGSYVAFGPGEYDNSHGTFIAGIINYGDELEGKRWTGTKPFKITEAVIYPNAAFGYIDEPMMIDFMREAITKFPKVKVWNFSIGNQTVVNDNQYSDFASFLDELQDKHNVLIIKAAGNCDNFLNAVPVARITEASESIRTLVVGSLAHQKSVYDLAEIDHPSPFSMEGPGTAGVIKPDLAHYGGNAGIKNGRLSFSGVKSFLPDGILGEAVGTSYACPRVTALAAELAGSLKDEFNPLLVKALLVHSAKHPENYEALFDERVSKVGFGLPTTINDILFNDPDEVTLILMDSVDKGSHIKIMDFPFPASLVENGYFYGQVKITLVTSPYIASGQGAEYIQSDIDVSFGSYKKKIEVKDNKLNRNPIDIEDAQNLLLSSLYSTPLQRSATAEFKAERFLKSYKNGHRDQFIPLKKWCIDLEELTNGHKLHNLPEDRLWFLKLEAGYRSNYDLRVKDSKKISQDFALIVTIKDTRKKGKIYNEVGALLNQFNFVHEDIKIDERIVVK
jgi:hypothetical protein